MWQAIFFDLDGTLIDSEPFNLRVLVNLLATFDISLSKSEELYLGTQSWSVCSNYLISRYQLNMTCSEFEQLVSDKVTNEYTEHPPLLLPGASDAIKVAHQLSPIGVVTGSNFKEANFILESYNLKDYIKTIVCGNQDISSKPSPEPYLTAAKQLNVTPSNCLAFEDSFIGIQSATASNMCVCSVASGNCYNQNQEMSFYKLDTLEVISREWFMTTWESWREGNNT